MEPTVGRARGPAAVSVAGAALLGGLLLPGDPLVRVVGLGAAAPQHASVGGGAGFPGYAVLAGLVVFAVCQRHALLGSEPFRAADAVTLLRTALLGLFAAVVVRLLLDGAEPSEEAVLSWPTIVLAVVVLLLDGVDGVVARSRGGGTQAGRRYDEVADAVVLAVLAAAAAFLLAWWALLAGAAKPLFVLAQRVRPRWRRPLGTSRLRRVLGTVPGVLMAAAISPLPEGAAMSWGDVGAVSSPDGATDGRLMIAGLAVLLVVVSFGRDVVALERRAAGPGRG